MRGDDGGSSADFFDGLLMPCVFDKIFRSDGCSPLTAYLVNYKSE